MVVQFVVGTETFALRTRTDTTRYIEFLTGHVVPDAAQGIEISRILRQCRHIGHAGIQVTGPHGMSHDFILLQNRLVVLAVFAQRMSVGAPSGFFDKVTGCLQVFVVACYLIKFHQSHFDDGMAARTMNLSFAGSEHLADEVGIPDSHIEQRPLAGCLIMGYGSLVQVAAVIQLMAVDLLPALLSPPAGEAVATVGDTRSQIAVRLLGSSYQGDDTIQIGVQRLVVLDSQRIRGSLNHLIRVGIVERKVTPVLSLFQSAGNGKIVETPILLTFSES